MKRLLKRWLALMLAVLMVMGTLPTTAFAARVTDDEKREEPVPDQNDPIVDTQAKPTDDETSIPVEPVDPSPEPVDPEWAGWSIEITKLESNGYFEVTVTANGEGITGSATSGSTGFILVPNLKAADGTRTPKEMLNKNITTDTVGEGKMESAVTNYANLTSATFFSNPKTFTMPATGKAVISGQMNDAATVEAELKKLNAVDADGNTWGGGVIPMIAILVTQEGSNGICFAEKGYGGGMSDSEWLINATTGDIFKIQKTDDGEAQEKDLEASVTLNTETETAGVEIPLYNTSDSTFIVPFDASGMALTRPTLEFVSPAIGSGHEITSKGSVPTSNGSVGKMGFDLTNLDPQIIKFDVPYYDKATADATKLGNVSVTVRVISGEFTADEIVFQVNAGILGSDSTAAPISFDISITDAGYGYSCLMEDTTGENGTLAATPSDGNLGLSFAANATEYTGNENGNLAETCYITGPIRMIYGSFDDSYEEYTGETFTGTAQVTLTPSAFAKDKSEYSAGYTYETMIKVSGAIEGDTAGAVTFTIPVKIIIIGEEPDAEFTYTLNYEKGTGPAAATGIPTAETYPTDGTTTTDTSHEFTISSTVPTSDTHNFVKWTYGGNDYNPGGKITLAPADTGKSESVAATLTAVWEAKPTYTVSFSQPSTADHPADSALTSPLPSTTAAALPGAAVTWTANPAANGWNFLGWSVNNNAAAADTGLGATDARTYTLPANTSANVTLYAVWEQIKHTVTYNAGKLDGDTTIAAYIPAANSEPEGSYTVKGLSGTTPTVIEDNDGKGWTFGGWKVGEAATIYDPGSGQTATYDLKAPVTFVAQWNAVEYNVTYADPNSGAASGMPDPLVKPEQHGATHTLAGNPTGKTGYTFDGWYNGSTEVTANFEVTQAVKLDAKWQIDVTFNSNGGSAVAKQTIAQGGKATKPTPNPSKSGYTFGGWYAASDLSGSQWDFDTAINAPMTLNAKWDVNQITYTFKLNGGNISGSTDDVVCNQAYGSDLTAPTDMERTGYKFAGWYTEQNGGTQVTIPATMPDSGTTVWAHWTDQYSYKLVYHANNGTGGPADVDVDWSDNASHTFTLDFTAANMPTRTNYTFLGWADAETDTTPDYTDATGGTKTVTATGSGHTLVTTDVYAVWERNQSHVKFTLDNTNTGATWDGANSADKTVDGNTGEKVGTKVPADPQRTGYNFAGWKKTGAESTTAKADISFPAGKGDTDTYVATWTPKKYTITWNANGGKWSDNKPTKTESLDYDSVISRYGTDPELQYYTFDGWYTAADNTGSKVDFSTNNEKVPANNDKVYYAHWVQKNCTVTVYIKNKPVTGSDTEHNFTGDVKLGSAGTYKATISNAATAIITVPQSDTSYDIYLGSDDTSVNVTPNGDTAEATVYFYELKVTAQAHGTATFAGTTVAGGADASKYYLPGTTGITLDATADTDWVFGGWSGETGKVTGITTAATAAQTVTTKAEAAALIAQFGKEAFTVKFTLNLDDKAKTALDSAGGDVSALTVVRTDGNADTGTHAISYSAADGKWVVSGLKLNTTYKITVTTRTGTYDGLTGLTNDKDDGVINLYSLNVAAGDYGNAANKPYLTADATNKPTKAVVPKGTSVPLAANPDNDGWTCTGWVEQGKNAAPDDMTVTTASATFTNDYNATTAGTGVTITPTYTYSTTVVTSYKGTAQSVTKVAVGGGTVGTPSPAGNYRITGLNPGTTYTVSVNDYASDVTFDHGKAGTTVPVAIHKISAAVYPTAAANSGATVNSADAIYVPNGAVLSDATPAVSAGHGTLQTGYRWMDPTSETLWAITAGADFATVDNAGGVITTKTDKKVTDDIVATAYAQQQWNVESYVKNTSAGSTAALEGGSGTGASSGAKSTKTLDAGAKVKVTFTPVTGETLKTWDIGTGTEGKWCATDSATESDWKDITANLPAKTVTEFYFRPTANSAITAEVEKATYDVTVTVNLDNAAYAGRKVQLKKTNTAAAAAEYTLTEVTGTAGTYTGKILPGKYYIWVDGVTDNTTADTAKYFDFEAKHADPTHADYDATRLSRTVNYYTLTVEKVFSDGGTSTAHFANHGGSAATAAANEITTKIVLAKAEEQTGQTVSATANNQGGTTPFYRFDSWSSKGGADTDTTPAAVVTFTGDDNTGVYTLPAEAALVANTRLNGKGITLTANFKRQFKVTVEVGSSWGSPTSTNAWVKKTTESSEAPSTSVIVDEGSPAYISVTNIPDTHAFADWTSNDSAETGKGTFDNSSHASSESISDNTVGYVTDNSYTPTKDTILTLNGWKKATLAAGWTYDKAQPSKSQANGTTGLAAPILDWTAPSAGGTISEMTIVQNDDRSNSDTLVAADYTVNASGDYVLTDTYMKGDNIIVNKYYTATFTYVLGSDGHPNMDDEATAVATFGIKAEKLKLTEARVQVEGDNATANPKVAARDQVVWKEYKDNQIDVTTLSFKWFYADALPYAANDGKAKYDTAALAEAAIPSNINAHPIGTDGLTGATAWPTTGDAAAKGAVKVTDGSGSSLDLRGKYIFAVVSVDTDVAEGAVITNAKLVDYDAAVTVNEDGDPVDNTGKSGYTIYLWPTDGGNFDPDMEVDGKKVAIPTTYDATSKTFKTDTASTSSALDAQKTYHVYVNEVESDTTKYIQHKNGSTPVVISRTSPTDTVDYYTVTLTDLGKKSWTDGTKDTNTDHPYLVHATDNASTPQEVGETWTYAAMPGVKGTTGNNVDVPSGKAVLETTTVKATAKALTSEGNTDKAWLQDYRLDWWTDMDAAGTMEVTASKGQTNRTAVTDGHTTAGITHATEITGKLIQNTYIIEGNVLAAGSAKSGQIEHTGNKVPTLTYQKGEDSTAYVFKATVGGSGGNGEIVTFTVPRSGVGEGKGKLEGSYTLAATPKTNPATTLKGYKVPGVTNVPNPIPWEESVSVDAGTAGETRDGQFTIFVEATSLTLEVKDGEENTTHHHARSGNTEDTAADFDITTGRHADGWTYNSKTAAYTREVIITNKGNTPLKVTPKLEKYRKSASDDTVWEKDSAFSVTADATGAFKDDLGNNKITGAAKEIGFSGWKAAYDLAITGADATATITVTVPANLENSDDVRYRFIFESVDGRGGTYTGTGPTLWFELETIVNPVHVSKVVTIHPSGDIKKYQVDVTTIAEDVGGTGTPNYNALQKPQDASGKESDGTPKADNDLVYEWYVADWSDHANITISDGKLYNNGTLMTKETRGVSANTLTFDLAQNPAAMGKTLYLLARGQNNATDAATTPDVTQKDEEPPMQMPYTGKVYIEQEPGTSNRITAETGYKVYLWNVTKEGAFDPTDSTHVAKLVTATWNDTDKCFEADGLYAADDLAKNAYTYQVWTNKVKGTTGTVATDFQNSGKTLTGASTTATVVYHAVTLNNTTVDNAPYSTNFTENSTLFYKTVDGTTVTEIGVDGLNKPTAKVGTTDVATSDTNKWVQTGTNVTFTYNAWSKDYKLTWSGGPTGEVTDKTANSTKTYQVNDATTVNTVLKLNLYDVKASVLGSSGSVAYVTMKLTDDGTTYVFTTTDGKPDGNAIRATVANWPDGVAITQTATFRLPASGEGNNYTVEAVKTDDAIKFTGYTGPDNNFYSYDETKDPSTTNHKTIDVAVSGPTTYKMHLQGQGLSLQISDNVGTAAGLTAGATAAKEKMTNTAADAMGAASIADGAAGISAPAEQEIHLNYNYNSDLEIIITGTNSSLQGDTKQVLKELKFEPTSNNETSHLILSDNNMDTANDLDCSGTGTEADPYVGLSKTAKLTVRKGLDVGTYTFVGTFSFKDSSTPQVPASVTYTIKVVVEPLPFTAAKIIEEEVSGTKAGKLTLEKYTVTRKAQGTETAGVDVNGVPADTNTDADSGTALIQNNDYKYQWISVKSGATPNVTWTNGTLSYGADTAACTGTNNNTRTYQPGTTDQGRDIYLVIYANAQADGINADQYAISNKIVNTYPGIVYLTLDGDPASVAAAGTDYTVEFYDKGTDAKVNTTVTWKKMVGDTYAFSGELTPNDAGYYAKISRAQGDGTNLIALSKTLNGTDIGTAADKSNVTTADFYTVKALPITAKEYQTGTGESFTDGTTPSTTTSYITPGLTIGDGNDALTNGTPVLDGQKVAAVVPTDKAWTQDYTLTWRVKTGENGLDLSADDGTKLTDTSVTGQTAGAAIAAGAYAHGEVSSRTYIGGRLDQKTYIVTGSIEGSGEVKRVTLTGGVGNKIYGLSNVTAETPAGAIKANNTWTEGGVSDGKQNAGDTYSFKVVKGEYTVTGYEGADTTIVKVTVDGGTAGGTKRNINDLTTIDEDHKTDRTFVLHLEDVARQLGVKDSLPTNEAFTVSVGSGNDSSNHQADKKAQEYYFNLIGTAAGGPNNVFDLLLSNPGNVELTLKAAPEIYLLADGGTYDTSANLLSAITAGTKLNVAANGALSAGSTTYTALTVTDLPAQNDVIAIHAGGSADGDPAAVKGGEIRVNTAAVNTDDNIYVVKYTSEYADTDNVKHDGPTVYYVFDLTVKPLPIVEVKADVYAPKADGTVSLKDHVAAADATDAKPTNDGLNSVLVDHDGDGKTTATGGTDPKGAKTARLVEADIKYIWYTAPVSMDEATVRNSFEWNAAKTLPVPKADVTGIAVGAATTNDGKTYKATDAEQGRNLYLIAYRSDDGHNATEFAVSNAVYAQVTLALKTMKKSDGSLIADTKVQITGKPDDEDAKRSSNSGTFAVNGTDDKDIPFVADLNAYLHGKSAGTTDDPSQAEYYFIEWKVLPEGKTAYADAVDTGITVDEAERLKMTYAVTEKATVVGYYDELPTLSGFASYNNGSTGDHTAEKRTLTYDPKDGSGSGNVEIWIAPADDDTEFVVADKDDSKKAPRRIDNGSFEQIADGTVTPSTPNGGKGKYVLTETFMSSANLNQGAYRIYFYDTQKGEEENENEGGYAGYDKYIEFDIVAGDKHVYGLVAESDRVPGNYVLVKGQTNKAVANATAYESDDDTEDGNVSLVAAVADGYVFDGWTMRDAEGNATTTGGKFGNAALTETTFVPSKENMRVIANFRKVEFAVNEDARAEVFYGDDAFVDNTETETHQVPITVTKNDAGATYDLKYALATEAETRTKLGLEETDALPKNVYHGGDGSKKVPAWLSFNTTDATFSVASNATGVNVDKERNDDGSLKKDEKGDLINATNELVVYVKVTEDHTDQEVLVPFTVDIMTTPLKVVTANTLDSTEQTDAEKSADGTAYKALFEALTDATYPGEGHGIKDGDKVFFDYFNYTNVQSTKNATDFVDGTGSGNGHAAYAAGAVRFKDLTDETKAAYGVVTNGYWTVADDTFTGSGENEYVPPEDTENYPATNAYNYTFTYHYTGDPTSEADIWNYSDTTIVLTIPAEAPEMSLKFADEMKASDKPAATDFDVKAGTDYSDWTNTAENKTTGGAPLKLNYVPTAKRAGETITYLDNEPIYTVKLKKAGTMYNATLTEDAGADGFKVVGTLPDINATGTEFTFQVQLTARNSDPKLWAGEHKISFTATGNSKEDGTGSTVTATYTLSITVDPKPITALDVTVTDDGTAPADVIPAIEGDPTLDEEGKDVKGNDPIKKVDVTWGPEENKPDGKNTEVKVDVEIDPNYVYEEDDENTDPDEDITGNTDMTVKEKVPGSDTPKDRPTPKPDVVRDPLTGDPDHIVHITQPIPYLMHDDVKVGSDPADTTGPKVTDSRGVSVAKDGKVDNFTINLGAYGDDVYDVKWAVTANDLETLGGLLTPNEPQAEDLTVTGDRNNSYTLNLENLDTSKPGTYVIKLEGVGVAVKGAPHTEANLIKSEYTFTLRVNNPPSPPSPPSEVCPCKVFYHIGIHGTTTDATVESVSETNRPSKVPAVKAVDGYVFRGWSQTNPATLKKGEKPVLVDPKTVAAKGETMTFYAVIVERSYHEHYVVGYPNGNFGPSDDITRASVATIIARAILPDFVEGANYGNPGNYSDVSGHWGESAIAYCSKYGVFNGMPDGTFQPDRPISRQEFALVIARLDGVMKAGEMDFTDVDEAGDWALGGIYTAVQKGWVNGYPDGSFKPMNNIRRDEAVKVFNAYLHRGVDANGLADLHEYVRGTAGGNGTDAYMTWPDVPRDHWAYYEIVEAANDHEFTPDFEAELGYTLPEHWEKCWINERWRVNATDSAAAVSAGFRVWLH